MAVPRIPGRKLSPSGKLCPFVKSLETKVLLVAVEVGQSHFQSQGIHSGRLETLHSQGEA